MRSGLVGVDVEALGPPVRAGAGVLDAGGLRDHGARVARVREPRRGVPARNPTPAGLTTLLFRAATVTITSHGALNSPTSKIK